MPASNDVASHCALPPACGHTSKRWRRLYPGSVGAVPKLAHPFPPSPACPPAAQSLVSGVALLFHTPSGGDFGARTHARARGCAHSCPR